MLLELAPDVGTDGARGVALPWFACLVRSNCERSAGAAIARAGVETFVPLYRERVRYSDRWQDVERVLFPSYLFVAAPGELLPVVAGSAGVVFLLPNNLAPVMVPNDEIAAVRRAVSSGLVLRPAPPACGERVEVMSGALRGLRGVVVRSKAGGLRLVVNVQTLSAAISIELDTSDVRSLQ